MSGRLGGLLRKLRREANAPTALTSNEPAPTPPSKRSKLTEAEDSNEINDIDVERRKALLLQLLSQTSNPSPAIATDREVPCQAVDVDHAHVSNSATPIQEQAVPEHSIASTPASLADAVATARELSSQLLQVIHSHPDILQHISAQFTMGILHGLSNLNDAQHLAPPAVPQSLKPPIVPIEPQEPPNSSPIAPNEGQAKPTPSFSFPAALAPKSVNQPSAVLPRADIPNNTIVASHVAPSHPLDMMDVEYSATPPSSNAAHPSTVIWGNLWGQRMPSLIGKAQSEFSRPDQFIKGIKWSPDGTRLLTSAEDNHLRLFDCSEAFQAQTPVHYHNVLSKQEGRLLVAEAETIYDFCWYPYSSFSLANSSVFITSTRDHPIHLWDAVSGTLRATYRAYDQADEITSAISLAFSCDGTRIYGGYDSRIRVFDLERPGREYVEYPTVFVKDKSRRDRNRVITDDSAMKGIISSLGIASGSNVIAAGTYSGLLGLYHEQQVMPICVLNAQPTGVTHVQFTPDGRFVFAGGRKSGEILGWDLRNTASPIFVLKRDCRSNQRVYFDIDRDSKCLVSGSVDGTVFIYDIEHSGEIIQSFRAHDDSANSVALHPSLPFLATGSGQRTYGAWGKDDSSSSDSDNEIGTQQPWSNKHSAVLTWETEFENSVKLWSLAN